MGYLQVLLAFCRHLTAAPVPLRARDAVMASVSECGAAAVSGFSSAAAPSCMPLVSLASPSPPSSASPAAQVRSAENCAQLMVNTRRRSKGRWRGSGSSYLARGTYVAVASPVLEPLHCKRRKRQLAQLTVAAMHVGRHTEAQRWCHSQSRELPSGDDLSPSAECRPAQSSQAAPHVCGDSKRDRPSLLGALLHRLQQTTGVSASDRHTMANGADFAMEIDAEEAAVPPPPSLALDASSHHCSPHSAVGAGREVYVPLLFRPDFQRANPHARRHAAAAITAADREATPAMCGNLRERVSHKTLQAAVLEATATASRSPAAWGDVTSAKSDTARTAVAASPVQVCNEDTLLEEFDIDSVSSFDPGGELGDGRAMKEESDQQLNSDAAARAHHEGISKEAWHDQLYGSDDKDREDLEDWISGSTLPVAPPTYVGGAVQTADRRSRHLILDPVEWLSQASDAPLMDKALLESNTCIKDQLAEALAPSASAKYTQWLRQHMHDPALIHAEAAIGEASPSTGDVAAMTAKGFDPETAAFMASASKRSIDAEEDTSLQEALTAELYADVSPSIRKQQWRRPPTKAKRSKAAAVASSTHADTNGDRSTDAEHPSKAPQSRENDASMMQTESLPLAAQSAAPLNPDESADGAVGGAPPTPCQEVAGTSPNAPKNDSPPAPAAEWDALVYNIFTRRIAKAGSMSIRTLALMGIGVDRTTRELCVTDGEALRNLAGELRAHRVSWPKLWSRGSLYQQIERLLCDAAVEDPVERVSGLLKLQYNRSHLQRQKPGLVVCGNTTELERTTSASTEATTAQPSMMESIDDKLLTLQDLNVEQQAVVRLVMQGHHTYIGGGAGTGKSVLLRVIKQQLVREGLAVAVTGTTGIAGSQIGGCTLHHCFGINTLGEFTRRKDLSSYDVVIIDEVSMLSRDLFESLEVHLRRANNVNLPFGGVQMILSGDFLQLGAIHAQPLITSTVFRRYFVQLKLHTVVRQNLDLRFATQLQQLRRGLVPPDLAKSVRFMSRDQVVAEQHAASELRERQHAQLQQVLSAASSEPTTDPHVETLGTSNRADESLQAQPPPAPTPVTPLPQARLHDNMAAFVDGAVNLLPTNHEVDATNTEQLDKLEGELMTFAPQFLPPSLVGNWSPTYLLRINAPAKLHMKTLTLEILRYLTAFYTHGQRASSASRMSVRLRNRNKEASAASENFSDGVWLLHPSLSERSIVLYPLFADALALRVRLPPTIDKEEAEEFLLYLSELDRHLESIDTGVRVRDVLMHADGMHTEQDEFTLSQYAQRTPLARPLGLKIGARVMLRANLAPGLVNGSLGTVVGFRALEVDQLPRHIIGNAQREESIRRYADYLKYEQGFDMPLVPVLDFNGRQEVIPPVTHFVGGLPNTHFYSMGIVSLPLSLAYAFTVHKVQGLTLVGRVHLELSRMWPCEHLLYVAMSRVRNPEQLSVSSFHPGLVRAAADCLLFDDSLPPVARARIAPYMVPATWRRSSERRKKVVLRKRLEAYVKKRQQKLQKEAKKGDICAEIRLLEEKMLKQRARALAAHRKHRSTPDKLEAVAGPSSV
ncbi:DNA repair and recombination helicase protein PIF2, putative [Leishmania tarentolae]|uniref:ATP-dependent DNA helicase n=1 Tax=Leishmania tarentolae TaxID=5689 RepID=A0A640KBT2_LEITA|nr:DNA repair and recombination helicase protein PIF2, putative [Leishmania tarentolae]